MKRIYSISFVLALTISILNSCDKTDKRLDPQFQRCRFLTGGMTTRGVSPDEMQISDLNIFIFSDDNFLEEHIYTGTEPLETDSKGCYMDLKLILGKKYNIFVWANLGYRPNISSFEELSSFRYHLSHPDDFRNGICMTGEVLGIKPVRNSVLDIFLTRTMAKISVRVDRSGLEEGIIWEVCGLKLCNCPKSILMYGESRPEEVFANGFVADEEILYELNRETVSPYTDLYTLESLENGASEKTMQYVEMKVDYISEDYSTGKNGPLTYRFKVSEDIVRNVNYRFRVRPEGDGLKEPGWDFEPAPYLRVSPGNLIAARVGDKIKIRCEYFPSYTPFDIGLEELEHDRKEGIYNYVLDDDGMGVELTCLKPGSGILYFTAGQPVNQEEMVLIVINPIST